MSWKFPIEGKILVVTGGGSGKKEATPILFIVLCQFKWLTENLSGIGLSYALLAQSKGAKAVILADVSLTNDAKLAIQDQAVIEFVECDVTKWSDLQNLIDVSIQRFSDVPDVFVMSAGVFEPVRIRPGESRVPPRPLG